RIGASPGDPMQRRQALAWLDSPEFGSALADFAKSEADLRQKESVSERARTLFDAGVLARKDLETALTVLRQPHVEHSPAQSRVAKHQAPAQRVDALAPGPLSRSADPDPRATRLRRSRVCRGAVRCARPGAPTGERVPAKARRGQHLAHHRPAALD